MRNIKFVGAFIIILMISLVSCAPAKSNTVVVRNQPRVVVVKQPRAKRVVVIHPKRNHRPTRVIVIR